jgi:hypothetical protein
MLSNLSMTTWTWNRIGLNIHDDTTNDLGWSHTQDFPLDGGQSLQRVILRLGTIGGGSTFGPVFNLVPAAWFQAVSIDLASPRGLERIYQQSHAAELRPGLRFNDGQDKTPWDYQYSIPAFDIDQQVHLAIPANNSGSFLRINYGVGTGELNQGQYYQYVAHWYTIGQISYLVSSQP